MRLLLINALLGISIFCLAYEAAWANITCLDDDNQPVACPDNMNLPDLENGKFEGKDVFVPLKDANNADGRIDTFYTNDASGIHDFHGQSQEGDGNNKFDWAKDSKGQTNGTYEKDGMTIEYRQDPTNGNMSRCIKADNRSALQKSLDGAGWVGGKIGIGSGNQNFQDDPNLSACPDPAAANASAAAGGGDAQAAMDECEESLETTRMACSETGEASMAGAAAVKTTDMVNAFGLKPDDPYTICKAQEKSGLAAAGVGTALGVGCGLASNSCQTVCEKARNLARQEESRDLVGASRTDRYLERKYGMASEANSKLAQCKSLGAKGVKAGFEGVTHATGAILAAKGCKAIVEAAESPPPGQEQCAGANYYEVPGCQGYCQAHPDLPGCAVAQGDQCQQAGAEDNPFCLPKYCPKHPDDSYNCPQIGGGPSAPPGGPGPGGPGPGGGSDTFGSAGSLPLSSLKGGAGLGSRGKGLKNDSTFNGYSGGNPMNPFGANNEPGKNGGGGQGPAAYAGGPDSKQKGGKGGLNTDIEKGTRGGGGMGFVGGTAGPGGGGGAFGKNEKDGKPGVDLSKFLPKDERKPADEKSGLGIAGPDGLSNFQRVSRKMAEKKKFLKPGT